MFSRICVTLEDRPEQHVSEPGRGSATFLSNSPLRNFLFTRLTSEGEPVHQSTRGSISSSPLCKFFLNPILHGKRAQKHHHSRELRLTLLLRQQRTIRKAISSDSSIYSNNIILRNTLCGWIEFNVEDSLYETINDAIIHNYFSDLLAIDYYLRREPIKDRKTWEKSHNNLNVHEKCAHQKHKEP